MCATYTMEASKRSSKGIVPESPYARVATVEVTWSEPRGDLRGFHVRH